MPSISDWSCWLQIFCADIQYLSNWPISWQKNSIIFKRLCRALQVIGGEVWGQLSWWGATRGCQCHRPTPSSHFQCWFLGGARAVSELMLASWFFYRRESYRFTINIDDHCITMSLPGTTAIVVSESTNAKNWFQKTNRLRNSTGTGSVEKSYPWKTSVGLISQFATVIQCVATVLRDITTNWA